MSSKRHHPHQGGTIPTTEPKDRPGVVQFSVSEVAQFSMSLDKCGLMPAGSALITLVPPSIDQAMLLFVATGTAEAIRPAGLLQGGLALLLTAVKPLELNQREALLELDTVAGHRKTSTSVPL
jgi:hypothetical protein